MTNKTKTSTSFKNIRFSLKLGAWEFTPGLIPSLLVLFLLPLLISLGVWQLHRAESKQQLINQFSQRSQQKPQPLSSSAAVFQPVTVSGYYDLDHPILLDNRIINHQPGYDVLVAFKPVQGELSILINLGWIPLNSTVKLSLPKGQTTISGLVQTPNPQLVLAHTQPQLKWPLLIEEIRFEEIRQILHRPLYPFILLLTGDSGFTHHWDMVINVTPIRHRGYAVQWFGLAATLLFLFLKLNIRRKANG